MWVAIIIAVISLYVAYSQKPAGFPEAKPPTLEDIVAPTAEEGRPIPVVFGTRIVKSPNVVWYGDLRYKAVKASGGGGK